MRSASNCRVAMDEMILIEADMRRAYTSGRAEENGASAANPMNLKQLDYFVHVAELGSFSKAALVLDIAQPALSRQVRGLETELRENLFLRNGRGVALTDAGKRLFDHGVAILRLVAHAREDLGASRDEARGRVTVG